MKVLSRTVAHEVFATACFSRTELITGQHHHVPASLVHAKTMGTHMTLCGKSSLSWFKFWDIAFETVRADQCPRCLRAFERQFAAKDRS